MRHETEMFDCSDNSIAAEFEKTVVQYPDRLAVRSKSHSLAYSELNAFANRIARAVLKQHGEGQEPVGILLEDDVPKIAAILGVLKAGKIYIPLDPSLPSATLTDILEDAQASLIITDGKNIGLTRQLTEKNTSLIDLDTLGTSLGGENLGLSVSPDDIAYILYTSGSTGKQKGVFKSNRNVVRSMRSYNKVSAHIPEDRFSLIVPLGFAGSVTNLFCALFSGASLFLFPVKKDGFAEMIDWIIDEEITVYQSAVSVFRHFVDAIRGDRQFPRLRLIDLFGEAVSPADVGRHRKHFPETCTLRNRFASTEAGMISVYPVECEVSQHSDTVPAGYMIEGVKVLILDENKRELESDQVGEIAVQGSHLASGYWRQPELTCEAFIPDPKGGSDVIFLTGDLGRMSSDGCLVFLGRKDTRVKIRGHRVELSAIEACLTDHRGIKEAIVLTRGDSRNEQQLVAYIVPRDRQIAVREVREFLKNRLPEYMVPAVFVCLEAFPLGPNGKVDRRGLPAHEQMRAGLGQNFFAPRNDLEKTIAKLWSEILHVEKVGIHDNFFDLGGNSLLLTQVQMELLIACKADVPLAALIAHPTVGELASAVHECLTKRAETSESGQLLSDLEQLSDAERVAKLSGAKPALLERRLGQSGATAAQSDRQTTPASWSSLVPIQTTGSRAPLFWIHGENSTVFLPRFLSPDQPLYGVFHQSRDGKRARYTTVGAMAAHYLSEIRTAQPDGPYYLGGFCMGGTIAVEMACALRAEGKEVALVIIVDPVPPYPVRRKTRHLSREVARDVRNESSFADRLENFRHKLAARSLVRKVGLILGTVVEKAGQLPAAAARAGGVAAAKLDSVVGYAKKLGPAGIKFAKRMAGEVYYRTGAEPIPTKLVTFYLDAVYSKAIHKYQGRHYDGEVIVLSTEDAPFAPRGFEKFTGGLQVIDLDAKHDEVMYEEPEIQLIAEKVKSYLEKAQTKLSVGSPF